MYVRSATLSVIKQKQMTWNGMDIKLGTVDIITPYVLHTIVLIPLNVRLLFYVLSVDDVVMYFCEALATINIQILCRINLTTYSIASRVIFIVQNICIVIQSF